MVQVYGDLMQRYRYEGWDHESTSGRGFYGYFAIYLQVHMAQLHRRPTSSLPAELETQFTIAVP
jgi:hypothetical protein